MLKGPRSHRSKTLCASGCLADLHQCSPAGRLSLCSIYSCLATDGLFHGTDSTSRMVVNIFWGMIFCLAVAIVQLVGEHPHQRHALHTFCFSPLISGAISKMVHVHELANWKKAALVYRTTSKMTWQFYVPFRDSLTATWLNSFEVFILHDNSMSRLWDTLLQNSVAVVSKTNSVQAMTVDWESSRPGGRACHSGDSSCYLLVV